MVKEWLKELDYLRGFAILGIIAIHSFILPPPSILNYYVNYQISPINDVICQIIRDYMDFAIPLFVLISGVALGYTYDEKISLTGFYKKRLLRIIPPYLLISLISIFGLGLLTQIPSLNTVIFKLLTGTASDPLWFVILIIQLYFVFPFVFLAILMWQRKSSILFILFPIIALLIQLVWAFSQPALALYFPGEWTDILVRVFFPALFFYFVIGIYFSIYYQDTILRIRSLPLFVPLVASFGLFLFYDLLRNAPALGVFLRLMFFISTIILVIKVTVTSIGSTNPLGSFIRYIGVISFSVYLIHPFFNYIFWILLSKSGLDPSNFVYFPVMFLLLVISSILAIKVLMRLPYHRWLIGI